MALCSLPQTLTMELNTSIEKLEKFSSEILIVCFLVLLLCLGSLVSNSIDKLMLQPLGTHLSPLIRCLFESYIFEIYL